LITIPSNVIGFSYITVELGYHTRTERRKDGRILLKWILRMENGGEWLGTVSNGIVWYLRCRTYRVTNTRELVC
jgi:hypothetical protein